MMTALEVTAFSGLWNAVVPAVAVLVACNVALGVLTVRLLAGASKGELK